MKKLTGKLKIDLDDLLLALDNSSGELDYYLDLQEGEILLVLDQDNDPEMEQARTRIAAAPKRYQAIPKAESQDGYRDMEEFIDSLEDRRLAGLLATAIQGKGAFRRFKNAISYDPEVREQWFRFQAARQRERAIKWLKDVGVELASG